MDQRINPLDLGDFEFGIEAVIGAVLPNGFDQSLFFVFPDTFLGEIDQAGDLVN
jgi:hypothetical protein